MDFHELALNTNVDSKEFKDAVYAKRLELIDIAIQWPGETTKGTMIFNNVWEYPSNFLLKQYLYPCYNTSELRYILF